MKIRLRPFFVPAVILACGILMTTLAFRAPSEAELRVIAYAKEKEIPYASYPESLIELLERNPEAEEFVLNYPFREEEKADLKDFDAGKGVPLFLQWDQRWGYLTCGGDFIGDVGSAPMCLAMAGYRASGGDEKFSPHRMAAYVEEKGYDLELKTSERSLITKGGADLGLKVKALPLVERKIADYLQNGDPIIASMGPGDFDNFVVLTGYADGMVGVHDPDSRINSEKQWSYDEVSGQIKTLWVIQMAA